MFPLAEAGQIQDLLALVDGVMLTGSPSNVHPSHFGQAVVNPSLPLDAQRDGDVTLVQACLSAGVPLLGICRLSRDQRGLGRFAASIVHTVAGFMDHREDGSLPLDGQYAPSHEVRLAPGSVFERWAGGFGGACQFTARAGRGSAGTWIARRRAPDGGGGERYEMTGASTFAYAVQWHLSGAVGTTVLQRDF